MTDISIHPRKPLQVTHHTSGGHHWIKIVADDVAVTFYCKSDTKYNDAFPERETLSEMAETLAQPHIDINFAEQAAQHDRDESNCIPMADYRSEMPF